MRTVRGRIGLVATLLAASVALGACGGGGNDSAGPSAGGVSDATTTQAASGPESHIAPDAEVTAGLGALKAVGDKVASASSGAASKAAAEGLEPVWQPIEGTVKRNEPDLYLDIEDSFQRMESGDVANARQGARSLAAAVGAYLARHPG
jgi:hypothetical protein